MLFGKSSWHHHHLYPDHLNFVEEFMTLAAPAAMSGCSTAASSSHSHEALQLSSIHRRLGRHGQLQAASIHLRLLQLKFVIVLSALMWSCSQSVVRAQEAVTNPQDLEVLYEVMYSINYEWDWRSLYTDPCTGGPQGIGCEPDAVTGIYYVTQMEFGFISSLDNFIPCSYNATIPSSIGKLTRLDSLFFFNCFVNQTVSIPDEIAQLGSSLRLLTFSGNSALAGSIPSGFGNLTGLQRLILSQNSLEGSIPEELSTLSALTQLDLSSNKLTGSIPESLSSGLSNLVILDMRYNRLNGEIPAALIASGFGALQRLALSNNQLQGSIPDAFTHASLASLTFLDLSYNALSGVFPPSLGNSNSLSSSLQDLFVSSNSGIDGDIPASLGNLVNLVRLDLSSSNYSGAIPSSFRNLVNLRYLGLSDNRLSGSIPPELADLPYLFTLNLDDNQLTGPIPFAPTFVQKMGRNLMVSGNPGLCYTPVVEVKFPLQLQLCPNSSSTSSGGTGAGAGGSSYPGSSAATATSGGVHSRGNAATRWSSIQELFSSWVLQLSACFVLVFVQLQ
ncbi:unnamed protein product [Sphagnum jensenii]|jgi:Leucine-rich repeat (LRR) protein|uniref:Disease resistance R13L4/SHOC-2-like LRR domain-containing protein n=1 Tax=Sphagnum jensenii TaxID=128206 RepID=A0ABP0W1P7_9BRYO